MNRIGRAACLVVTGLVWLLPSATAAAGPRQNLLTPEHIDASFGVIREQRLVDGLAPSPESPVDDFVAALFMSPDAFVSFDLGAPVDIAAVQLLAIDELISVDWSVDGQEFLPLQLDAVGRLGSMSILVNRAPDVRARYLRLAVRPGHQKAAVSEFVVLDREPASFPIALEPQQPPSYEETVERLLKRKRTLRIATFLIALLSIPALVYARRAEYGRQRIIAVALALTGALGWIGFGTFHGDGRILHPWELVHYYLGPKYFRELGYTELYRSLVAHERERGRGFLVDHAEVRDLSDNRVYRGRSTVADPHRFRADRWEAFGQDADRIRRLFRFRHFHKVLADHGYNGTPLQTAVLAGVSNKVAVARPQLLAVAGTDFILIALGIAAIWWAFGPLTGAAGLLCLGLANTWSFSWTGGSIGRYLWFALLCGGLSLLHRKRYFWGGLLTAASGLLRLFPLVLLGGLALHVLRACFKPDGERRSFYLASGVALALALGIAIPAWLYGVDVYAGFLENSRVHGSLPPGNHLGWGVLCSAGLEHSALSPLPDAGVTLLARRLLWAAGLVAALVFLAFCVKRRWPLWTLLPLASPVLFASIPLSNYDYVWLIILVPLALGSTYRTALLFGFVAITNFVDGDPKSLELQHAALSAALLVMLVLFLFDVVRRRPDALVDRPRGG